MGALDDGEGIDEIGDRAGIRRRDGAPRDDLPRIDDVQAVERQRQHEDDERDAGIERCNRAPDIPDEVLQYQHDTNSVDRLR
ncbi:MAG: hypothetical protein JO255_09120 [Alphaproteobacteria bacterium]|nr:hypothetical protein [Alphaproteobacteria bacterium]